MVDVPFNEGATPDPKPAPPPAPDFDPQAEIEKWKALARKHEDRAKANVDKARTFDDLQAKLTGAQSEAEQARAAADAVNQRIAALEEANRVAQQEALRARVAAAKGVPEDMLQGNTLDELEAYADRLIAYRGGKPAETTAPMQGKQGDPLPGKRQLTEAEVEKLTPDQLQKAMAEGLLGDLLVATQTKT
jgi:hypothetical protein